MLFRKFGKRSMPSRQTRRNVSVMEFPRFRLNGRSLVFFGAWANHCALYPGSSATLKKFRNELRDFQTSKGTLRFSPDNPLPVALVKKLVKARVAQIDNDRTRSKSNAASS